ncbi:MAG: 6-phosphogluconolactonase [Chloroflexota bacterium]|nr:6-phosphogluconolactonase [Chloroflexota bacterium]
MELDVLPVDAWAERVASDLAARLVSEPSLRLCLPTGDTPAPVYAALAARLGAGEASLEHAMVVLLDEWVGLDPDDPARCDGRLRRELLDRVSPGPAAFHRVLVDELAPDEAAAAHDEVAARGLSLTLLGLGSNGHVGFNEPGSNADSPTRVVDLEMGSRQTAVARYGANRVPEAGITLGISRLMESDEIWLLVTGASKAEILDRALRGPVGPGVPASFLRSHPRSRVIADTAAAGLVIRAP